MSALYDAGTGSSLAADQSDFQVQFTLLFAVIAQIGILFRLS